MSKIFFEEDSWNEKKNVSGGGLLLVASSAIITLAACSSFNLHKDNVIRNAADNTITVNGNRVFTRFTSDTLEEGNYLIGGELNSELYLISSKSSNNFPVTAYTSGSNYYVFNIVKDSSNEGLWNIKYGENYLYASSSSSNHLKIESELDDNGRWTYDSVKSQFTAKGTNTRNIMRFNSSNNPKIISCYSSGQKPLVLYKEAGTETSCNVQFIKEDSVYSTKIIDKGSNLVLPEDPVKEEDNIYTYTFDGWYVDDKKYTSDDVVETDLILTAKFNKTKKPYSDIFKTTVQSSITSFDYKYQKEINFAETNTSTLPEGNITSSEDNFIKGYNLATFKGKTYLGGFKNTQEDGKITFENGYFNKNVKVSFPYSPSNQGQSYLDVTYFTSDGNETKYSLEKKASTYSFDSSTVFDENTYITKIEITYNKVNTCNVYISDLVVEFDAYSVTASYKDFNNLALSYGFKYTFQELTEVTKLGAICTDDINVIPEQGVETIDSSIMKVETDIIESYNETGYFAGLHYSTETIKDDYEKIYYFATYYVIDNKYYFSSTYSTSFKASLATTINEYKLGDSSIISGFEKYFGITK